MPQERNIPASAMASPRVPVFCWTKNSFTRYVKEEKGKKGTCLHTLVPLKPASQRCNADSLTDPPPNRAGGIAFGGHPGGAAPLQKRSGLPLPKQETTLLIVGVPDVGPWRENTERPVLSNTWRSLGEGEDSDPKAGSSEESPG